MLISYVSKGSIGVNPQHNSFGFRKLQLSATRPPLKKRGLTSTALCTTFFLLLGALVCSRWIVSSIFSGNSFKISVPSLSKTPLHFPLNCNAWNQTQRCPNNYPTKHKRTINPNRSSNKTCPDYFRWIHEDLRHWKETGITRDMVESARKFAYFRLIILNGKAYVDKYRKSIQTRDVFTVWGIVQLLRWYPGRLPDLELMFDTGDRPVIRSKDYRGPNAGPPPLFRYCSDWASLDIVFPDWSFWGWAETNIKPWRHLSKDIKEGNKRIQWEDRLPLAYWKGNPNVHKTRQDLLRCNVSDQHDWNAVLYIQDWIKASTEGYKQSKLEDQCTHRYKIYIEGWAWSVSEKYILACNSPTLYVTPNFHDFLIRGMVPQQHYWPIRENNKCKSLKFAVEWGNNHTAKAKAIGEAGSNYILEDTKMENVYDYMFHLLNEYAKLLKYKPSVPETAIELCPEVMACPTDNVWRRFMDDSLEETPNDVPPCALPPPYDPQVLKAFVEDKVRSTKQVEMWEKEYWDKQDIQKQ
ncbi:uncharacterized protein LOC131333485 isoform X2 [Rhododendron vialii]|uniref:uncharacterized protein LOC131333485 isoform X2 n=1 Tax=Rhododendron vialii TaxID=182163 RepID=UPI00265F1451|nr:uncharacterized protein LOC131333485 isoform X2 [Rhododendron vialii]